jgi:hypothetical protein
MVDKAAAVEAECIERFFFEGMQTDKSGEAASIRPRTAAQEHSRTSSCYLVLRFTKHSLQDMLALPSAGKGSFALGKAHTTNFRLAQTSSPSAFCRALGKEKWP